MTFLSRIASLFRGNYSAPLNGSAPIADERKQPEPFIAPPLSEADLDTLVRTLHGEVRGEPRDGAIAVAHVIRNRAIRRGTNAATECLRPWQFSCWNANDPNRKVITSLRPDSEAYRHWVAIAREAWARPDITGGALHYFNPAVAQPAWRNEGKETIRIGGHVFRAGVKW